MALVLTSENFETEVLKSEIPVLVDFYADWCGPCKMMAPIVEELATQYQGKVKVGKLNVDTSEAVAARYGIMSIPTILIFKNGENGSKLVGVQSKQVLDGEIKKVL